MRESDIERLRDALKIMRQFCAEEGRAGGCVDCPMYVHFCINGECPKITLENVLNRPEQTFETCGHVHTGEMKFGGEITYCEINGIEIRCCCEDCEDFISKLEQTGKNENNK